MPNLTHNTYKNHAVILLASGLSQRLGTPKQLLTQHGQTLIEVMIRRAFATHPAVIIVVIPEGHLSIKRVIDRLIADIEPIEVVFNKQPEKGVGHSLSLGIDALNSLANDDLATRSLVINNLVSSNSVSSNLAINKVMILGVDQILLDTHHLKNLLKENTKVVASRYAKSDKIVQDNIFDSRNINKGSLNSRDFNSRNATNLILEIGNNYPNYTRDIGLDSSETVVGLPIVIDYELLKNWQSSLQGDKGLRHQIRALVADEVAIVDNFKLSLDIDTPEQLKLAINKNWLDR